MVLGKISRKLKRKRQLGPLSGCPKFVLRMRQLKKGAGYGWNFWQIDTHIQTKSPEKKKDSCRKCQIEGQIMKYRKKKKLEQKISLPAGRVTHSSTTYKHSPCWLSCYSWTCNQPQQLFGIYISAAPLMVFSMLGEMDNNQRASVFAL